MTRLCSVPGCGRPHKARGLCSAHCQRRRKGIPLDTPIAGCSRLSAPAAESRRSRRTRAIDYAIDLLSDPHCIYTPEEAWARACDSEGLTRSAVPPEVSAAVTQRPSRRDVLDTIAERRAIDCEQACEVIR